MEVSRYPLDFAPAPPTQEITEWMQLTRFRIRGKQFLIWAMDFLRWSSAAVAKTYNRMIDTAEVDYGAKLIFYCPSGWSERQRGDGRRFGVLKYGCQLSSGTHPWVQRYTMDGWMGSFCNLVDELEQKCDVGFECKNEAKLCSSVSVSAHSLTECVVFALEYGQRRGILVEKDRLC